MASRLYSRAHSVDAPPGAPSQSTHPPDDASTLEMLKVRLVERMCERAWCGALAESRDASPAS